MKQSGFELLASNRKASVQCWLMGVWFAALLALNVLLWLDIEELSLRKTEEASAQFASVVESQDTEPISSTTYFDSATTVIRQQSVWWSQALESIDNSDFTQDLKIISLAVTTDDPTVRISVDASDLAGVFVFIDKLNLESRKRNWILESVEATSIANRYDGIVRYRAYLKYNS